MEFELAPRTLFLVVTGSQAYGMATADSDHDVRGVAVAPLNHYSGFFHRFQQAEAVPPDFWTRLSETWTYLDKISHFDRWPAARETKDIQIMDLQKFCRLAADANPNVIEQLYVPYECIIGARYAFTEILRQRDLFLSKKVRHSFAGYAHSQIKRIRGHRVWLQDPPKAPPTRDEFGLPEVAPVSKEQWRAAESMVERRIQDWLINPEEEIPVTVLTRVREAMTDLVSSVARDQDPEAVILHAAARQLGFDDNFIEVLDKERRYRTASRNWKQYNTWKKERNPARAALEEKHGYDTKHASHVVRLTRMCEELLTTGKMHVDRRGRDADELLAIRGGAWSYEKLEEFADAIDRRMDALHDDPKCPLPHHPDRARIDKICSEVVETFPHTYTYAEAYR